MTHSQYQTPYLGVANKPYNRATSITDSGFSVLDADGMDYDVTYSILEAGGGALVVNGIVRDTQGNSFNPI